MKQRRPTQAIILAAGLATRLRPLTHNMPKACLPVWNRPAIHHVLNLLERWGVRDVLINLHHEPLTVLDTARAWTGSMRLNFSFEAGAPLGTGGALRHAAWFLSDRPFWLVNADVMADCEPDELLRAFDKPAHPLAALWMIPDAGPRTVALDNGFVSNFAVPEPGSTGAVTFSGVHLVSPEVLRYLPPEPFSSIIAAYRNAMADGRRIAGVICPGSYWEDIGILSEYLRAHGDIEKAWLAHGPGSRLYDPGATTIRKTLERQGVRIEGFAAVAPDARIGRGSTLRNCVIWPGATAARGTEITEAVLARDVAVHGSITGMAVPAPVLDEAVPVFEKTGWAPAETTAIPLGPRGSDRSFARLQHRGDSAILVRYGRERFENSLYASHTRFLLKHGIRVPRLLADDPVNRMLLFEDCGRHDLLAALEGASPKKRIALYGPVLDLAARLHTVGTQGARDGKIRLVAGFSPALYRWERLYFAHHFLQKRLALKATVTTPIVADLRKIAARLQGLPRVLIHRDLQSTNVILMRDGPVLIDYQGMRYGAAAYDLASLLADPYVSLAESEQLSLLEAYRKSAKTDLPDELFWTAAVQRLAQALGAYAKLSANPGTAAFARHIPPALAMMRRAVQKLGEDQFPHLAKYLQS
jgi:NDP-sugar pyrophosphorylase family protein/aminoglycoside/choline kinase family phosphotransferase